MHESNLHHLITDLTIRRGDWDAYVAECEYHGGAAARAFAERVRKLEVGPDYEGVAMTQPPARAARAASWSTAASCATKRARRVTRGRSR